MKRTLHPLLPLLALAGVAPAHGAEIVFFEREGFRGRSFSANQTVANFANIAYNQNPNRQR